MSFAKLTLEAKKLFAKSDAEQYTRHSFPPKLLKIELTSPLLDGRISVVTA